MSDNFYQSLAVWSQVLGSIAFVVVLVCCIIGLMTRGGPREIGAAVTRAVVTSLILILVLDFQTPRTKDENEEEPIHP